MPKTNKPQTGKKPPLPLWQAILLIIVITFGLVLLFIALLFLFVNGAQQMKLPLIANLTIFVILSGIFAWLLKRLSNIVLGISYLWFSEEPDEDL